MLRSFRRDLHNVWKKLVNIVEKWELVLIKDLFHLLIKLLIILMLLEVKSEADSFIYLFC